MSTLQILFLIPQLKYFRRSVLHQKKVYTAGYGVQFSFGDHDNTGARPGTYKNPTKKSSCMTTEEGPVDSRFEYCDTQKVSLSRL